MAYWRTARPRYMGEGAVVDNRAHPMLMLARLIWTITSIILVLLAIRFFFVLFGANPDNGIANFIYTITHPLVNPFFSLFNYHYVNGVGRFEGYTLVAMAIYGLIGYGLGSLLSIGRPAGTPVE